MGLSYNAVRVATSPICRWPSSMSVLTWCPFPIRLVRAGELSAQPVVSLRAVVVHTSDGDRLAFGGVLGGDGVEGGNGGGIPDVRAAHVDDDVVWVACVVALVGQAVAGGED